MSGTIPVAGKMEGISEKKKAYSKWFYQDLADSEKEYAPLIVDCIKAFISPRSVVDVGCGAGNMLQAFMDAGVANVQGVDLPGIDAETSLIPQERFVSADLSKPFTADRTFDLVVSLETAEHLSEDAADTFVETLVGLGPVIVFSAAIPSQGGWHHLNEQWPDYWAEKFASNGCVAVDCLRDPLWKQASIPSYYRQNIFVYVRQEKLSDYAKLATAYEATGHNSLARVHPEVYNKRVDPRQAHLSYLLQTVPHLPGVTYRAVARRLKRLFPR